MEAVMKYRLLKSIILVFALFTSNYNLFGLSYEENGPNEREHEHEHESWQNACS